ncbi:CopG family transcriptional regulator [Spirochaetia bacterium]|nr:CopG family transcriptional regulator [Spirochaetia bacterium]
MPKRCSSTELKNYIALFEYEEGSEEFGVIFPDLPGCFSAGTNYADAVQMAHEALALYADGEDNLPEPRTLEEIKEQWADWHEWEKGCTFFVGEVALYPLKPRARKFNISMDESFVSRIDRVTKNRSAFIERAVEKLLETGVNT